VILSSVGTPQAKSQKERPIMNHDVKACVNEKIGAPETVGREHGEQREVENQERAEISGDTE